MLRPSIPPSRCLVTWWRAGPLVAAVLGCFGCAKDPLEKVPPPVVTLDNELAIQGEVCASPPADAVFPVKILFLVDVSGSLVVTDPAKVRVQAIAETIEKYQGLPGVEFGVITFNSEITQAAPPVGTGSFTSNPDMSAISMAVGINDDLTDTQGVFGAAYEALTLDMLQSTPAERARSKYIIIFFTDGIPDPVCSADVTPCGSSMTCQPGTHCVPTTILSPDSQQVENYQCTDDYLICSVPKKDWGTAFNPPLDPALYPQLQAGANYNTIPQILASVNQIMQLQNQYHVGSITINTNFLFPIAALSNPLAVPFGLDRPYADELLNEIAAAGQGTFQEFTDDSQISFLNINFASLQVQNTIVQSFASNTSGQQIGSAFVVDTDGDGLPDSQEEALGTCTALSVACPTPWDSDGDGYSDFLEVLYKSSGFDPLDPTKPATLCATIGQDSDGDGLMDCEEAFLGTDPLNPDTDGDFLSDLAEVRHGTNPLDPTDAYGDINRDGILNEAEIKDQLSATLQVAESERIYALDYSFQADPAISSATGVCYKFLVQHMRLLTTGNTAIAPEGDNRIYYDVFETAEDSPTNLSTVRRACADVLYIDGKVKLPLTGAVSFVDSDFVDITQFDPTMNCKDLTKGFGDAGVDGARVDGATGGMGGD